MKIAKSGGDNRVIDPGMYRVKCTAAVAVDKPDDAFGKTKKVRVNLKTVEVVDDNGDAILLEKVVNQAFNPKSNLYAIFQAFGLPVDDDDYEPDTDDLLGKEANAVVIDYVAEGDGSQWSRIERLIALPKARGSSQKAATPAQEAERPLTEAAADVAADRNAVLSFYEAAEKYADRGEIADMADQLFGKTVSRLTTEQRDELLAELSRGVLAT